MYKYKVESLTFKNGTKIPLGRINVLVGANNCGKTQVLKDISTIISGENVNRILVDDLGEQIPSSFDDLTNAFKLDIHNTNGRENLIHLNHKMEQSVTTISGSNIKEEIKKHIAGNKQYFHSLMGPGILTYLSTENRLTLSRSCTTNDPLTHGPRGLLDTLFVSGNNAINIVRKIVKEIFNKDVYLDCTGLGQLKIRFGNNFSYISENIIDASPELAKYQLLDNQGDGIRSIVGIISALVAIKRPIILMDEPEAFLHPPQALQLGQCISKLIDKDQQIFIASHSADFLRGLLSSTKDAVIIHMDRSTNDEMDINILDSDMLNNIIHDPLLSSSRVLEGMFYKGVVATEGDADAVFYQRAFQKIGASEEIHFVNAHNKQTLRKIVEPYKNLGIKYAMISDFDVFRDLYEFRQIISICNNDEIINNILQKRTKLCENIESQNNFEKLKKLKENLMLLASKEIPENANIASELYDLRRQLKNLRDDSDNFSEFKKNGYKAFPEEIQNIFFDMYNECISIGLFLVKTGELESLLTDYGIESSNNKSKWIINALEKLFDITPDKNKELWKFIYELKDYIIN